MLLASGEQLKLILPEVRFMRGEDFTIVIDKPIVEVSKSQEMQLFLGLLLRATPTLLDLLWLHRHTHTRERTSPRKEHNQCEIRCSLP